MLGTLRPLRSPRWMGEVRVRWAKAGPLGQPWRLGGPPARHSTASDHYDFEAVPGGTAKAMVAQSQGTRLKGDWILPGHERGRLR